MAQRKVTLPNRMVFGNIGSAERLVSDLREEGVGAEIEDRDGFYIVRVRSTGGRRVGRNEPGRGWVEVL